MKRTKKYNSSNINKLTIKPLSPENKKLIEDILIKQKIEEDKLKEEKKNIKK